MKKNHGLTVPTTAPPGEEEPRAHGLDHGPDDGRYMEGMWEERSLSRKPSRGCLGRAWHHSLRRCLKTPESRVLAQHLRLILV